MLAPVRPFGRVQSSSTAQRVQVLPNPAQSHQGRGAGQHSLAAGESDTILLASVRGGDSGSYEELFRRYQGIATHVARAESDNPMDADDVVSEAFASILESLLAGRGPVDSFRAYLVTTVRRMSHRRNLQVGRATTTVRGVAGQVVVIDDDPVLKDFENTILMLAFRSLPSRWQTVLWHVDVEDSKPAAAAQAMDLTPNAVSSLLIRARECLRQAYLQKHVQESAADPCTDFSRYFGKYVRNAVRQAAQEKVRRHLDDCLRCAGVLAELVEVQSGMKRARVL
ncbi:sigma-70 family RNA polymerase sigma factor [Arthrobacter sp. 1088]|uniref:RNA polymerase sigma factor n=1 Tax=Arthrobacter sp. 1088 TaxID=2817768 RepID=UPI00286CFBBB|nr:sigma-70 family RNA polymerase sigma factor [Arthrobacter sp. 1088]